MRKKEPLIKLSDAIRAFCEDGTWLERQGVYSLTLAEAKQRAVDILESVPTQLHINEKAEIEKKHKDEPTISKMEQVDEPRKEQNFCGKCRYLYRDFKYGLSCYRLMDNEPCKYEERKDEPQIQLTAKCLNCNNAKACKEKHWDGCVYEPKDEKTCETCRHWKYIAHEWQCEACKCQGYEPKDEPQTDCAWT